jgi:hypothetical protein
LSQGFQGRGFLTCQAGSRYSTRIPFPDGKVTPPLFLSQEEEFFELGSYLCEKVLITVRTDHGHSSLAASPHSRK